jgi:hypothetical protein
MEEEASDIGGYVGWVMAYNKTTLVQSGVFATVTTGTRGGGVWQSGRPPAVGRHQPTEHGWHQPTEHWWHQPTEHRRQQLIEL